MRWTLLAILGWLILGLYFVAAADTPAISFIRPPAFVQAGDRIPFALRVPSDPDNRSVSLSAFDKSDGERVAYSLREIDGQSAQLLTIALLLPGGDLTITAALMGSRGVRGRVSVPIVVRSRLGQDEDAP